jgi:hypothetical protein
MGFFSHWLMHCPSFGSASLIGMNTDEYLSQYHDRHRQVRHLNTHIQNRLSNSTKKAQPIGTTERLQ